MIQRRKRHARGAYAMSNAVDISCEICRIVDERAKEKGVHVTEVLGCGNQIHAAYMAVQGGQRILALSEIFVIATALEMEANALFELAYQSAKARPGSIRRPRQPGRRPKQELKIV